MVKFGLDTTSGAPSLSGQAGALIALLDAYLINGFLGYTPPPGWVKAFSGVNKAAYRSAALGATGFYLYVDDTTTTYATVTGYEDMTDINTGITPWGTVYWQKSSTADAVARKYAFICDEMFMTFAPAWASSASYPSLNHFGDFVSDIPGDGYKCYLSGNYTIGGASPYTYNQSYALANIGSTQSGQFITRPYTLTAGGSAVGKNGFLTGSSSSIGTIGISAIPNPANGDIYASPIRLHGATTYHGTLPGEYQPLHNTADVNWSTFTGIAGLVNRTFLNLQLGTMANTRAWIDLTGPWR